MYLLENVGYIVLLVRIVKFDIYGALKKTPKSII